MARCTSVGTVSLSSTLSTPLIRSSSLPRSASDSRGAASAPVVVGVEAASVAAAATVVTSLLAATGCVAFVAFADEARRGFGCAPVFIGLLR